jgi:hypothetical protein
MDPVATLKRPSSIDFALCILCQTDGDLRYASNQGLATLAKACETRKKLRDQKNRNIIDRLDMALGSNTTSIVWHKNCYAQFTDKNKLLRLERLEDHHQDRENVPTCSSVVGSTHGRVVRRSSVKPVDWTLCIFCQDRTSKERLSSVMTFNVSKDILEASKLHHKLCFSLAGVSDLIAAEAKYHLPCLSSFKRSTSKVKEDFHTSQDLPLIWLSSEIMYAAQKGHVLRLSDVWDRYVNLSEEANTVIPKSFVSRRTTFREKLQSRVGDTILFVQPDGGPSQRETLLVPSKYTGNAVSGLTDEADEQLTMPRFEPEEDIFLSLVHVALKLRGDLLDKPGHVGFEVSVGNALSCVPESVYMFLKLLYGGPCQLEIEPCDAKEDDTKLEQQVLSSAQDMVYGVSGGSKLTPKHIGLGSTLHQTTRSKELVEMFHKAGHTLSYHQVLQLDTTLAKSTIKSMNPNTGAVIPPNLVPDRFLFYTADNIDILDETLDGKETFHATQLAAWQRGPSADVKWDSMVLSKDRRLHVPEVMDTLNAATMPAVRAEPSFSGQVEKTWYHQPSKDTDCAARAQSVDLAFNFMRLNSTTETSWTVFNESLTQNDPPQTTVGYMPIIQAPAHEFDTLKTVVERCLEVSSHLGQEYTVLSVDQALYCKLMELKWCNPEYKKRLIPRLGGLHISMNFLKVIGEHMRGSGLAEAWVEAGLMGQNTIEAALAGKKFNKAMRARKMTCQALWRLLGPNLLDYVKEADEHLHIQISKAASDLADVEILVTLLTNPTFSSLMSDFLERRKEDNVNFSFWWGYLEMVAILLMFTRAQRDGLWDLHIHSFTCMLPFCLRYDHINYGRWGPVYLAEMRNLPESVLEEFKKGNFVVKRSARKFNQVDPDQAQEWLNGTGKRGGGIVGITKTNTALNRWALSYNLRAHIAADTREMLQIYPKDLLSHNESKPARQQRDNADENVLLSILERFHVFAPDTHHAALQNIATKDVASEEIQTSLLNARVMGQKQLDEFVEDRLVGDAETSVPQHSLYDTIKKNKAPTFDDLYKVVQHSAEKNKRTVLKADQNFLQRLVTAYASGRTINLDNVLNHELLPVPVSLAELNGNLRTGNKALLADMLTADVPCPATLDLHGKSACLVIDGQARVVAIGKPVAAKTFGDLADVFTRSIFQSGMQYLRIDVVFDRYRDESIKAGTRTKRTKTSRPIRRIVEGQEVPLPNSWINFIALPENKADLARFLSEELLAHAPGDTEIVVAGGFDDEREIRSSRGNTDLTPLKATHEEADTRIILHVIDSRLDTVVVCARDTDVMLLLVAHFPRVSCRNLWMMAGTAQKRKYIPIGPVYHNLPANSVQSLLPFHALTGSDTTSHICGHTKRSAWKVFLEYHHLLVGLGVGNLTPEVSKSTEIFVCKIYGMNNLETTDSVRRVMFEKACKPEAMPPTSDALKFHIQRVHYQSLIWKEAHCPLPNLPNVTELGWKRVATNLQPVLMTLHPIPESCLELVSCSCRSRCRTMRCSCRKAKLGCTAACVCRQQTDQDGCFNDIV